MHILMATSLEFNHISVPGHCVRLAYVLIRMYMCALGFFTV